MRIIYKSEIPTSEQPESEPRSKTAEVRGHCEVTK